MAEPLPISWTTEKRRLGDLVKWAKNPRKLTEEQAERLGRSITEFGYSQLYEIEPDNTILDGHQRDEVMLRMEEFGEDIEIEVRVSSRKFTLEERKAYIALKHRGAMGEWDPESMMSLYSSNELLDFGFTGLDLIQIGYTSEKPDYDQLWAGMPEFEQENKNGIVVTVHLVTEADREEFFEKLGLDHTDRTRSIWYPERPEELVNQLGVGSVYTTDEPE